MSYVIKSIDVLGDVYLLGYNLETRATRWGPSDNAQTFDEEKDAIAIMEWLHEQELDTRAKVHGIDNDGKTGN